VGDELFHKDESEAWSRYLASTRGVNPASYEEVEPWAWRRLAQALEAAKYRLKSRLDAAFPIAS
jgi:hypothetical protein